MPRFTNYFLHYYEVNSNFCFMKVNDLEFWLAPAPSEKMDEPTKKEFKVNDKEQPAKQTQVDEFLLITI